MTQVHSPAMSRRRLGVELRRLRARAGRTSAEVAATLGWSPSKLSRVETGKGGLRRRDLDLLLDLYHVADAGPRAELVEMLDHARAPAWWAIYQLPGGYQEYLALEAAAVALDIYQPKLVPGLLQTAEYARAVNRGARAPADLTESMVKARLARQDLLARELPPRVRVLLDEAVLRRPVGGPDVMRRQAYRLLELSDGPAVEFRVLPDGIGEHACMAGSFIIVTVADDVAPEGERTSVYTEGMTGGLVRSLISEVEIYQHAFDLDWQAALDDAASSALLRRLVDDYRIS